jgi:hypothetical protein
VDAQITAIVFFYFQVGRGGLRLILLDYFITKNQTATQLYCYIHSNSVLQLYSFDSGYSLVFIGKDLLSGGRGERIRNYIFFFNHSFPFFFTTIKLIYMLVYQPLNSYFLSVFWNMNLSQTVGNHIIGIYIILGKFIHVRICHFTCILKKDVKFVSWMVFIKNA